MFPRWPVALALAPCIVAAPPAPPEEYHVVSEFFSDHGALFYYRVLEVSPNEGGSLVRWTRVGWTNPDCPRMIVQSTETIVRNRTPQQLLGKSNPCAVSPAALEDALKKYARSAGILEAFSFGIAARCGGTSVVLGLPHEEFLDRKRFARAHSEMARLLEIPTRVIRAAFGPDDIFQDRPAEEDAALQSAGQRFVPQLLSGRYDRALAAAVRGNVGKWDEPSFRALLQQYRGPISAAEAKTAFQPRIKDPARWRFLKFQLPVYPPLARQARIQGEVELRIQADPSTGDVIDVLPVSGHRLLGDSAAGAARNWRFEPGSLTSETVVLTLVYDLRCP